MQILGPSPNGKYVDVYKRQPYDTTTGFLLTFFVVFTLNSNLL